MAVDDARQKFEKKWQKRAEKAAEMARWKPAILGPAIQDYRKTPSYKDVNRALSNFYKLIKKDASVYGLTEADFWDSVRELIKNEASIAQEKDQTELYEQTEAETEAKRGPGSRAVDHKVHKIFRKTLRRVGFLPALTRGEWKEKEVSQLGKKLKADDFPTLELEVLGRTLELANIDLELQDLADQITAEKKKIPKAKTTAERQRIEDDILAIRGNVSTKATERVTALEKLQTEDEKYNLMLSLIKAELEVESREIQKKWGGRIEKLTRTRETLIQALDKATKGTDTDAQKQLNTDIKAIELQLIKIRKEIVDYKAKWPIFLFERFTSYGSIPSLKKLYKATVTKKKAKVAKPPYKIPEKDIKTPTDGEPDDGGGEEPPPPDDGGGEEPPPPDDGGGEEPPPETPEDPDALKARIAELEAENEGLRAENDSLTEVNRELNAMYSAIDAKNKELIAKVAELENKLIEEEELNKKLKEDIREMAKEIASLKETLRENKTKIAALTEANKKLADELSKLMEDKEVNEATQQEIDRLTQALAESEESKSLLEERLAKTAQALLKSEEHLQLEIDESKKLLILRDELRAQVDRFAKQLKGERKDKDKVLGDKFKLEQQLVNYEELQQEAAVKQLLNQENEDLTDKLKETEQTLEDVRGLMAKMEESSKSTKTDLADIKGVNQDMSDKLSKNRELINILTRERDELQGTLNKQNPETE